MYKIQFRAKGLRWMQSNNVDTEGVFTSKKKANALVAKENRKYFFDSDPLFYRVVPVKAKAKK